MKYLIFIVIFLLIINLVNSVEITGSFVLENSPPEINNIKFNNNILEIEVIDLNSYQDIKEVKILFGNNSELAKLKSSSGNKAVYIYNFKEPVNEVIIKVSDSKTSIEKTYSIKKSPKTNFLKRTLDIFRKFFTGLF